MGRPNRTIEVNTGLLYKQIDLAKSAIHSISNKDSLNMDDIQAIKDLTILCESTINYLQETNIHHQEADTCDYAVQGLK